ncbi:MAG: glycosyltransferase family 39 protein [Desulfobacteraceae bacterium]|nr:glycosyltransferase family 39 protein [Desulfobacteraceae bacterium]
MNLICRSKSLFNGFICLAQSDKQYFLGKSFSTVFVFGIATLILLLGIVYSFVLADVLRFADETLYVKLASNLLSKNLYSLDGITPSAARPPGHTFIVYLVFLLGGNIVHVRIVQYVFFALSLFLIYLILRLWSYRLASLIVCFFIPCYPVLFYTAGTLYPQTLTSLLILLSCYLVVRRQTSLTNWLLGGLTFGYLLLTNPTFLIMTPVLIVFPWALKMRNALFSGIIFVLSAAIVVTPWIVRNYKAFDRFVPISANSGYMLILGNSENTKPNLGPNTNITKYVVKARAKCLSEIERDAYFKSEALKWIFENKADAFKLYILKFLTNFHFRNELATHTESKLWRDVIMFVTYYAFLCMAMLRVFTCGSLNSRPYEVFAVACYVIMGAAYAIFFTRIRYRLPLDWLMISMAAIYAASLFECHDQKSRRQTSQQSLEC